MKSPTATIWGLLIAYVAVVGCVAALTFPLPPPHDQVVWPILGVFVLVGCTLTVIGKMNAAHPPRGKQEPRG